MSEPTGPTVKLVPDFKVGETIVCKSTKEEFTILEILPNGKSKSLRLTGRAGLMPVEAAEKKL